jgi:hypothetical protein
MCNALITANVFQNVFKDVLGRPTPSPRYYADLIRRLTVQPVTWYMTALDYALAHAFWDIFRLRVDEACQKAYWEMLQLVRVCPIDEWILEESGYYCQINYCDALRLATAVANNLDAIVTWEPYLFVRTVKEHHQFENNWYFFINIPTRSAELDDIAECRIGVFAVGAFLLSRDRDEERRFHEWSRSQYFCLNRCDLICTDTHEASVVLCVPNGDQLAATAIGTSPFDAIQRAVDQVVNQAHPALPPRYLSRFFVPQATLFGADAPVEVVIRVECAGESFQECSSHSSVFWAAADAYVKVINKICRYPNLPVVA